MAKYTPQDIEDVARLIRHGKESRPFVLLTGAGCSLAAGIPLAGKLVEEINAAQHLASSLRGLSDKERTDYGRVMARLTKNERKDLLDKYLDKAKINWAHIAIAALMGGGYISKTLTFNFDNVLARACGICGLYPATYDFVTGASPTVDHIISPAIVHLHGQGYGLSMLNSDQETTAHANKLQPLLADVMRKSPLLVIGYSGEAGAVFPMLRDSYGGENRLFWAGHEDEPKAHVSELVGKSPHTVLYLGGVDADRFLVELAQAIGCWPPMIFSDPIEHIRGEIAPVTDFPTSEKSDSAIDVLAALEAASIKYS